MQKCRPCSLCHTHAPSVPYRLYDVHCSPPTCAFPPPPLPLFSSLPSRSPLALCHLLSGISSRLTGLAVTLDFKELLHSSVTHQKERAIQRCAKREGGDEEWVYKKEKKKECALGGQGISVWKEGTREKGDPLLTAGDLGSHKSKKKGHAPTHPHTHTESLSALKQTVSHLFSILLGVCRCLVHISFHRFLSISVFSLCLFFLSSHSSHLSQRCRGGVESRSFCNPLTAPGYFFFSFKSFLHDRSPLFLNVYFHSIGVHWHSPSFFPFLCILRWLAS